MMQLNPNHRNYQHHLYLRNMNPDRPIGSGLGGGLVGLGGEMSLPQSHSSLLLFPFVAAPPIKPSWRLRDRMKTVGLGLVMALNVGTDPPDVIKPHPCAKLQCWMKPYSESRAKAKEKIGERLEKQYGQWQQARASTSANKPWKVRKALDPTVEDVRALCLWLRKQAKHERILLHYNGHGVPRPTPRGEIWVFDKNHTEYIPLPVSDLRQWAGKPTIVILDCSSAGVLIPFLTAPLAETPASTPPRVSSPIMTGKPAGPGSGSVAGGGATAALEQQQQQQQQSQSQSQQRAQQRMKEEDVEDFTNMDEAASHWVKDTIVLCPTSENEWLPMNPEYPADIFTSCLTTPIQMALRWFVRNNRISMGILFENHNHNGNNGKNGNNGNNNSNHSNNNNNDGPDISVDSIPGQLNDRKTPLGELNWIFTSVTDCIAWNGT